ncbi:3-deoxy-D-manno-octulosonate 8-phosphate phosphatase (KDO 8-P phosphatase) [Parabacteroides sp. PF5-5]|uniref:KdsC family phosphatase n=1 Tax=unclassified Parabacteroides TaxID=2649774 RepID=UPI0024766FB5|nr:MULTISPECIES: HAD hydrolase family protein [unclassified Parabacteroides]MDH6306571.1 3-deoxy-D-manno-octulosonate 8-phosphate phosphatase (KDO 8-P phosphatase) [Parabacteroides sp. PH5-39]MDH6317538.1 3-deoxy-D-manno-octulosonate 8-phosphate phosphatase (KDO 8-P phosphatase) [Parabacteroides sp. PF5-13]MDH6321282.1 3-deoxy-D-manno-octulosonate 8-phosphate phosphatase (KDO 8-P phosphatase) [Parabacteroides sp. PH5-13]MDH6325014.1 3-deoxy-D-manno-octulosonate 8-phosphate phosphatase (KDO 8-P 
MSSISYDLTKIKAFVFDVDGVLSHEVSPLYPNGEPMRTVSTKDGYAIHEAVKKGFQVGIITTGHTEAVHTRFSNLGAQHIYLHSRRKMDDFEDFISKTGLKDEEIIYVGDDLPDYEIMKRVGLPVAPADAVPEIKAIAKYISSRKGGESVARDVIEQTLRAQGLWMSDETAFIW